MKRLKTLLLQISLLFILSTTTNAQLPSLDFLYGYTNDAKLLLQEYMSPYANIMGSNLNAGWYNTAEPHKLGGIDITGSVSVAFAPPIALSYDLAAIPGLIADIEGPSTVAPTIAGEMETLPILKYSAEIINPISNELESYPLLNMEHPNGGGLDFLPMPMVQASIGLIKGTDISVRYFPTTEMKDYGNIGMWGVGAKHLISQYIPVLKKLKFISISLQGGYTQLNTMARMDMQPNVDVEPMDAPNSWDGQEFHMSATGWTVNLIASQSLPIITVYEGIGYSNSLVDMNMLGRYPIYKIIDTEGENLGKTTYQVVEDPITDLSFESYNNLRLNMGVRLKLGVITLHYDFTKTLYATHSAGIGLTFR